uniref:Uncharacterized protein n=1 Tax=Anguilla anguilla TaxID=7936 RepID=A0A0E9SZ02_ANGAN
MSASVAESSRTAEFTSLISEIRAPQAFSVNRGAWSLTSVTWIVAVPVPVMPPPSLASTTRRYFSTSSRSKLPTAT